MTCGIPKHPADPAGERCGAAATEVRILYGGPPCPVCEAHAVFIDRTRGHGPTAAERAQMGVVETPIRHRTDIRRALLDIKVACDDTDAVTEDMLRPAHDRELGPVLHARNYREARHKFLVSLAYLTRQLTDNDGEYADPAGSGGAGPAL